MTPNGTHGHEVYTAGKFLCLIIRAIQFVPSLPTKNTVGKPTKKIVGKPAKNTVGKPTIKIVGKPTCSAPVRQARTTQEDEAIFTPNDDVIQPRHHNQQ